DTLLSYATQHIGRGKGFGIHKMLDQMGAMLGPVTISVVLFLHGNFRTSFLFLFIPAAIGLFLLFHVKAQYQHPRELEVTMEETDAEIPRAFWFYFLGASLVALGYSDFPLIGFHFEQAGVMPLEWIPIVYALALGVSSVTSLYLGYLFDHNGSYVLVTLVVISALFAPFVFLGHALLSVIGMVLWGVGSGAQLSLLRAIIARIIPADKRAYAYGLFNGGYGLVWFVGSSLMGVLYNFSLVYLVVFSVCAQLCAVPVFLIAKKVVEEKA
ncbi:MAG: MFS transporter, partial [Gammaproteobacteria bacterium]|nr:MFS transporter [Gammaproteobacteria bacterium]